MRRSTQDLEPTSQPDFNRLVVGATAVKIEWFEPVGRIVVDTPSGRRVLSRAAVAEVRCPSGRAVYLYGERAGRLVGARAE